MMTGDFHLCLSPLINMPWKYAVQINTLINVHDTICSTIYGTWQLHQEYTPQQGTSRFASNDATCTQYQSS